MCFFLMGIGSTSSVILSFFSSLQEEWKRQDEVSVGKQPLNDKFKVDSKVDVRIMMEEMQQLIFLSVSLNKLSKLLAEEYASLIMVELDLENFNYIERGGCLDR
ncbi:hypothetical protein SORBI_3009G103650 [Sorghum bicolor]|uniref:Uncharacterized protein n=1 Tax=Sorghum bicolor TaxID=4558 RepID=A0A1Z5R2X7_SORBI|nr:hypothetical protein SORBI_3009G103650 [Sorghum bicolor]